MFLQTLKQPVHVQAPDGTFHLASALIVREVEPNSRLVDGPAGGIMRSVDQNILVLSVAGVIKADGKQLSFEGEDFLPEVRMKRDNLVAEQGGVR